MSLDIRFTTKKKVVCPHCGETIKTEDGFSVESGGRAWYQLLEEFGYYDTYDSRLSEWYGKDMTLTEEQMDAAYKFAKSNPEIYESMQVQGLLAAAKYEGDDVVVNADW